MGYNSTANLTGIPYTYKYIYIYISMHTYIMLIIKMVLQIMDEFMLPAGTLLLSWEVSTLLMVIVALWTNNLGRGFSNPFLVFFDEVVFFFWCVYIFLDQCPYFRYVTGWLLSFTGRTMVNGGHAPALATCSFFCILGFAIYLYSRFSKKAHCLDGVVQKVYFQMCSNYQQWHVFSRPQRCTLW